MITVLIVDDHNIVRLALKNILKNQIDIKVVGEADSGEKGIQAVRELKPDVVLMDIEMPGVGGLGATRKLLEVYSDLKIIILSAHQEDPFPTKFIEAGVAGYLTKNNTDDAELIKAIHYVVAGNLYITPQLAEKIAVGKDKIKKSPFVNLSQRELEIMLLILNGEMIKDIAKTMNISEKTVSTYRSKVFEKLHVKNDIGLMRLAYAYNIFDDMKN